MKSHFWCGIWAALCISVFLNNPSLQAKDLDSTLTREQASDRAKQVTQVSYTLWFALDENLPEFEGRTTVQFDLTSDAKSVNKKIRLDLEGGTLQSIQVNGTAIPDIKDTDRFDGHHITFRISELKSKGNTIEVRYSHPYSTDGNGLHRFLDPADNQTYVYSNFEPYTAHRLFPCFDQPDIKATYQLTAEAPVTWTVISSTLPKTGSNPDRPATQIWTFPTSALFSTYLFSLHAGPFASWSSSTPIPLRLFARKSLAKYVDHQEWIKITQSGLDFYSTQFGYPYPFGKYDQILVPDFNPGAMENVAAVTFSENFIFRGKVTENRLRDRANVILHEMAHMWFGNLVTMKWWNGLWLNESFATYMASWAVDQATQYKDSWNAFARMKQGTYWEDQMVTTHPVEMPVHDTLQAEANFDGITYGKGAASLQQLRFYLGEDDFREGLQRYFQKYAFRNTTIHDFFRMLSEASNKPLTTWQKLWLQTTGVNTIQATWKCDPDPLPIPTQSAGPANNQPENNKKTTLPKESEDISEFELKQFGTPLRPHRTQLALYSLATHRKGLRLKNVSKNTGNLIHTKTLNATYINESTRISEAIHEPCPDFVFPNFEDQDYVKIELDSQALEFVSKHFKEFEDPLIRQILWHTLWEMVVDGKMKAKHFADLILTYSALEKDTLVLEKILSQLTNPFSNRASVIKYIPVEERAALNKKIEKFMLTHLTKAPAGSDLQLIWYRQTLNATKSNSGIAWMKNLLTKKIQLPAFKIDQERRWELVQALAREGDEDSEILIQAELDRDQTDAGEKSAIAAEALLPDPIFKKKWLRNILRQQSVEAQLPVSKLREAMARFHTLDHENFTQESVDLYFTAVAKLNAAPTEEDEYVKSFTRLMFPSLCTAEVAEKTKTFLDDHSDLKTPLRKSLRIALQEEERCIRARKLGAETAPTKVSAK